MTLKELEELACSYRKLNRKAWADVCAAWQWANAADDATIEGRAWHWIESKAEHRSYYKVKAR